MLTIATVTLGEAGLTGLRAKVDKLNRRAVRYGMDQLVVTVTREFTVENKRTGCDDPRYDVQIEGCAPCIEGWHLAARLENNDTIGIVVRIVPGKFADLDYSGYRNHDFSCDHCETKRRRNDVFVLADDDGCRKVVGRNCLADYLRCEDARAFVEYAEWCELAAGWTDESLADEAYEEGFGEKGGRPAVALDQFLSIVSCCTRRLGWTSRSASYGDPGSTATADDAYFVIFGRGKFHEDFIRENELHVSDGDKDTAAKATEWVQTVDSSTSEYLDTIRRIGIAGMTDDKLAGYAASIIRAYQKDCEWAAERAEKAAGRKERVYIGDASKKGQQDLGRVRVVRLRSIETEYGVSTIVAMEADMPDGSIAPITWFATGDKVDKYEEGKEYTLRAGVKDHNDDPKWGKQTKVTRARLTALKTVTT